MADAGATHGKTAGKPGKSAKKPGKGGGPALDLSPARALHPGLLILAPLLALSAWCLVGWQGGPHLRHAWDGGDLRHVALIAGGGILALCALWAVLPIAHWLRRYPAERFGSGSKVLWFVPLFTAAPLWMALYVAVAGCLALGGYAAVIGLLRLGLAERIHALAG